MQLIAKTIFGAEEVLAEEIKNLGVKEVEVMRRAVAFEGDQRLLYRANLELRTALRILVPIFSFTAKNEQQLYKGISKINWTKYLTYKETLAVDGVTHSDFFTHSKYVALKTKDAIVDQIRDKTGRRPNINTYNPNLRVNVHIYKDEVNVSLDSSGDSLHRRGYRVDALEAPMSEVLAATLILLTGWKGESPFVDPMCGSGTLPIEAAMIALKIPPNINRPWFGFQKWNDYDEDLWEDVKAKALAKRQPLEFPIYGFDQQFKAIRMAQRNADAAELDGIVDFKKAKFEKNIPEFEEGLLVINPPYDERLTTKYINDLYKMMGDQLKQQWQGWQAWIISSNKEAMKQIGLRPSFKKMLYNGALECRYAGFELYAGSRKQKYQV